MLRPPIGFPGLVRILNLAPGAFASTGAAGILKTSANASVRIEGDAAGVFSVVSLETLSLQRDPDLPRNAPPAWETVDTAQGAGPISVESGQALVIFVGFACPADPDLDTYTATAVAYDTANPATTLLSIPLNGTVSPGTVTITALGPLSLAPGQTATFPFRLASSRRESSAGVFTCDSRTNPAFASDTAPQFPTLPPRGSLDLPLAITCAPGTPLGPQPIEFRFFAIDNSIQYATLSTTVNVMAPRSVEVSTNLTSPLQLGHGSSTPCDIRATISGGPGTFSISPASIPNGVSVTNGNQTVPVDGGVLVAMNIEVAPQAAIGLLAPPLVLQWTVPANALHPAASGSLTFDIVTPKRQLMFGFSYFKVENCRSKGDHNDSDTLVVVVSTNRNVFPGQQILLGDNLHAGHEVRDKFVGPFEIDDSETVTVTYTVVNGADGDKSAEIAEKITGIVLGVVAGLEEAHFLGLVASKVETGILGLAGGVFGAVGELVGLHPSNPDCSGAVLVRTITYGAGQLTGPQDTDPVLETQRSSSECGNDPHSTVIYAVRQLA